MAKKAINNVIKVLIAFLLAFLVCGLIGCTSTKYVPVETIRIDTLHHHTHSIDSIIEKDSIVEKEYIKGDTVFNDRLVYRNRYITKLNTDTIHEVHTDTITKTIEVERKLSSWQKFKMNFGVGSMISLILLAIIIAVVEWIRKKKS